MARVKNEMTGRLLHCMLILAGVLLYCNGEYCQLQYSTLQTCDIISGTLLTTHAATRSIFDCVRKCNDITCHSAVYNIISSKCRTYSDIGWGLTTGCPETVIIAYLDSKACSFGYPPGSIFGPCAINADCAATSDAECRNNKCLCVAGLSHDSASSACLPDCLEYGSTFQEDLGHYLNGFSNKQINTVDPVACMDACEAEITFVCRTAEVDRVSKTCHLSVETRATQPTAYLTSSELDLYQRDCAP